MRRTDKVPAPSTERFYPACHLSELSCGKAEQTGLKSWAWCLRCQGGAKNFWWGNVSGERQMCQTWSIISGSRGALAMSCVSVLGREITVCMPWNGQERNKLKDYKGKCSVGPRALLVHTSPPPTVPQVVLFSSVWFVGDDHDREERKSVF